jgi:PIF1-like helicase/Helitron helicase-like domain at N-terminus
VEDVNNAIEYTKYARGSSTQNTSVNTGNTLLNAIDAVSRYVPHSNEATKQARRCIEAMQHVYGCPSFFLSVTPDDENHLLIQIYSNKILQFNKLIRDMTNEEIQQLSEQKLQQRIRFPGVCAFFYLMLDIIYKQVLNWDKNKNCPQSNDPTVFGKISAIMATIEEQGRRSLHVHMLIWNSYFNKLRDDLFETETTQRHRSAKQIVLKKLDEISSTKCYFHDLDCSVSRQTIQNTFPHECHSESGNMCTPKLVQNQQLRNLRLKKPESDSVLYCELCNKTWTQKEIITLYLQNFIHLQNAQDNFDINLQRLKSMATELQYVANDDVILPKYIIDCVYNHHIHTNSCFKTKTCKDATSLVTGECRYQYPQLPKTESTLEKTTEVTYHWYKWNGDLEHRSIYEISLQQNELDVFINASFPHICYSKMCCNTNIAIVIPGLIAQYLVNYTVKNTQKDDVAQYELLKDAVQKVLAKFCEGDSEFQVAIKRLLSATYAHQSVNIVGAAMASYLTRNGSRFYFSHSFTWCPLNDMHNIMTGNTVSALIYNLSSQQPFFHCQASHYICRPASLENVCAYDFFSKYEVKTITSKSSNVIPFQHTSLFKHPSYCQKTKKFIQGVLLRDQQHIIKISQYQIPDSALFNGNFLLESSRINESTEKYCEYMLMLFLPFRTQQDLMVEFSYSKKFKLLYARGHFSVNVTQYLQNIQNTKSNNFRSRFILDELQRNTATPTNSAEQHTVVNQLEEQLQLTANNFDDYFATVDNYITLSNNDEQQDYYQTVPNKLSCANIRNKGRFKCGYDKLPTCFPAFPNPQSNFITTRNSALFTDNNAILHDTFQIQPRPTQQMILSMINTVNTPILISNVSGQSDIEVYAANGTIKSIISWSNATSLDQTQQRAFEIIVGSFILSIYDTAHSSSDSRSNIFDQEYKKLQYLVFGQIKQNNQLICLLHGPAGSGKTAVIDLVLQYTKIYCSLLWSENNFNDERVVVVTAMTGVAATLLGAQTTHSALYLNQKKEINAEQIQIWHSTRLVIIDEISFASKQDIVAINDKLKVLKQCSYKTYGGINVIFCGDFRQLEPVGYSKKPSYEEEVPLFEDSINCYIELKGKWRFQDDPQWGNLLSKFQDGNVQIEDIQNLNYHITHNTHIPYNIKYATYFNQDRDSINTGIFQNRAENSCPQQRHQQYIIILSDDVSVKTRNAKYVKMRNPTIFWENCGENDIKLGRGEGRMDPVLKLYVGCRVMLTVNLNVDEGQANGTQAIVQQIVLKDNEFPTLMLIQDNITIPTVFASQVEYITLQHTNQCFANENLNVKPSQHAFSCKMPDMIQPNVFNIIEMKAKQFSIVSNDATTGHKLQGTGVNALYVHNWSYRTNWVYVVLSRVRTLSGLFARRTLSLNMSMYTLPKKYTTMINKFLLLQPCFFTQLEYENIIHQPITLLHWDFPQHR